MAFHRAAGISLCLLLGACAHTPPDEPDDPLEGLNRSVYGFNETLDRWVARPVAESYVKVVPNFARQGVNNFLSNATYPTVIINDFLQGKYAQGFRDTGRFLFNTTVGMIGLVDAAAMIGLEANDEDFGQTLGYWGVGQGWFLMLPLLGPTTNRDGFGSIANGYTNPLSYTDREHRYVLYGLDAVNSRAALLGVEGVLEQQFDRYAFVRGAYLQRRLNLTYDGDPPKELMYGEDFEIEEDE